MIGLKVLRWLGIVVDSRSMLDDGATDLSLQKKNKKGDE